MFGRDRDSSGAPKLPKERKLELEAERLLLVRLLVQQEAEAAVAVGTETSAASTATRGTAGRRTRSAGKNAVERPCPSAAHYLLDFGSVTKVGRPCLEPYTPSTQPRRWRWCCTVMAEPHLA
jgi:hypothetical protein